MKHKGIILILMFATLFVGQANAQRRGRGYRQLSSLMKARSALSDSLQRIGVNASQALDSLAAAHAVGQDAKNAESNSVSKSDFNNPYYYPLFAGNTFMHEPLHYTIGSMDGMMKRNVRGDGYTFVPRALPYISWTLAESYALHPEFVMTDMVGISASSVASGGVKGASSEQRVDPRIEAVQTATAPVQINKDIHNDKDVLDLSDFHIHIRRPNFWTIKGQFSTQFMQYYVSDNWYKGGDNHVSMLGNFNLEANYDNKQKITFTNKLETKLGFQTSPNDTYHKFKTNADLLRLTDKLGIQAHSRWYYTIMLQSWTQFYKGYKSNAEPVASDFMSPFESVLSVGMDYKLQKKRVNLTATISPGAANLKYCDRTALVKNHGIEEGKHYKIDLGSTVTVNMTLKFCDQINWVTRLYAFYDYKKHLKAEWENTINLKINKYLSTKLFLYPRFDNNVTKKNPDDSYFQFNEYLSVGLDLNF